MVYQDISLRRLRNKIQPCRAHLTLAYLGCLFLILIAVSDAFSQLPDSEPCPDYLCEREPKRLALVVGNKNYTHLAPLESAQTDADTMKQRLTELGFEVSYYPDVPSVNNFQNVIFKDFRKKIEPGDFVVFYFSGHGFSYGPNNYLAPTEMPLSVPADDVTRYAISVDAFEGLVASHSPGLIMFFIDACRSIGGFILDKQNKNVVGKGPGQQRDNNVGVNSAIFYATRPGTIAQGSSLPGQLSIFTQALADHISIEGQTFGAVFNRVKATVRVITNGAQIPGDYNFSATDPYLKPTEKNLEEQREAWLSVLDKKSFREVETFFYLYSVSRHSTACRKWLNDNFYASRYTAASPVAIDRAWIRGNTSSRRVLRLAGPFAFSRSLEASQVEKVQRLPDSKIGLVSAGASKEIQNPLELIDAHQIVVAKQQLEGRAEPNAASAVVARIPAGTQLQINNVAVAGSDNNLYVSASTPDGIAPFFIRIPQKLAIPEPLELGQSVKEIIVSPRPNSAPGLVDPVVIHQAVAELKAQGWTITWVSLATAPPDKELEERQRELEEDTRTLQLANAEYLLKRLGINVRRITSVSGTKDFSGDGVRVRFFGFK